MLAGLCRPGHAYYATESHTEQEVKHGVVQRIMTSVSSEVERLEGISSLDGACSAQTLACTACWLGSG